MTKAFRDKKVAKFEDFLPLFEQFVSNMTPDLPFTKTAFIASKLCNPASSGLIIKIDSSDYGSDRINYENFINDPNFIFFTRAAQKFGFKVDKNAPFRLVADLGSKAMAQYMLRYPLPPQYYPPQRQLFYVGDKVLMFDLYSDLGWNGPVFDNGSSYHFRIIKTEGDIAFLSLLPYDDNRGPPVQVTTTDQNGNPKTIITYPYQNNRPGRYMVRPEEGSNMQKIDPRLLEIINAGVPFEFLDLHPFYEPSENRQNVER